MTRGGERSEAEARGDERSEAEARGGRWSEAQAHGDERSEGAVARASPSGAENRRALIEDSAFLLLAVAVVAVPAWLRSSPAGRVEVRDEALAPVRIDANRAPWYEWLVLDGIGESRARRIVEYREAHGPFRSVEDLAGVPRMPEGWIEKAREHLTIEGVPLGPASPRSPEALPDGASAARSHGHP